MDLDKIIALVQAGYTKADIEAMQAGPAPAPADPTPAEPEPAPTPADPTPAPPAPVKADNAAPVQQPAPAQPSEYEKLESLLKQFIGVAQSGNLNAGMNSGVAPQRTSTDILGAVIAPPQKGQNK